MNDEPRQPDDFDSEAGPDEGAPEADDSLEGFSIYDIIEQQNEARAAASQADEPTSIAPDGSLDEVDDTTPEVVVVTSGSDKSSAEEASTEDVEVLEPKPEREAIEIELAEDAEVEADDEPAPDNTLDGSVTTLPTPMSQRDADEYEGVTITVQSETEEGTPDDPMTAVEDSDTQVEESATPPPPVEPEWKVRAREIYEEREAQKREMIQSRRKYEKSWLQARREEEAARRIAKQDVDEQIREQVEVNEQERQTKLDDMMTHLREERERKRLEREAMDRKLREERERRSYLKHRNQTEQSEAQDAAPVPESPAAPIPPPAYTPPPSRDLEDRLSRLSKPAPSDATDEAPEEDGDTPS